MLTPPYLRMLKKTANKLKVTSSDQIYQFGSYTLKEKAATKDLILHHTELKETIKEGSRH